MARTEDSFLDDPITPAPVFAYRALRGLIFGSPDPNSSPERVQHRDKENISPPRLSTVNEGVKKDNYTPETSPQKRKRGIETIALSPSKTLAVPVSPSKGILRIPGVETPRAKALQKVTVKFRSLSPELRRKETKHEIVLEDAAAKRQKTRESKTKDSCEARDTAILKEVHARAASRSNQGPSTSVPKADFEAYQHRTEKEMKMLIGQRQKWREYARLQDEENAKLKRLLEEAQKENERLERKLRLQERVRGASDTRSTAILPYIHMQDSENPTRALQKAETSAAPAAPSAGRSISHSLETRLSQLRQSSAPSLTSHTLPARSSPSPSSVIAATIQKPVITTAEPKTAKTPAAPSPLTVLAQKLEPEPDLHTSSRTNLAPERYSAARQRVMQKRQARKVSALGQVAEESNIDWVDLG